MAEYDVKVLGFGDNVVDKYEHIKTMYPGGNAVNFAVYSKMFGAKRSAYMGYFGDDMEAKHVISCLCEEGIETIKCRQLVGENGCARVTVKDNDRIFLGSNEGGIRGQTSFVLDRFDIEYINGFDLVHSGNYCFTERQLPKIKAAGIPISFDFSDDSTDEYYADIAPLVDYAFMSCSGMDESKIHERLQKLAGYGVKVAIATLGSGGSIAFDGKQFYVQKAHPVEHIVDTMGAGDSFLTSFLVSYTQKVKDKSAVQGTVKECMEKAAVFASKVCGLAGSWGHGKVYG